MRLQYFINWFTFLCEVVFFKDIIFPQKELKSRTNNRFLKFFVTIFLFALPALPLCMAGHRNRCRRHRYSGIQHLSPVP
jgi:hypothetical protein